VKYKFSARARARRLHRRRIPFDGYLRFPLTELIRRSTLTLRHLTGPQPAIAFSALRILSAAGATKERPKFDEISPVTSSRCRTAPREKVRQRSPGKSSPPRPSPLPHVRRRAERSVSGRGRGGGGGGGERSGEVSPSERESHIIRCAFLTPRAPEGEPGDSRARARARACIFEVINFFRRYTCTCIRNAHADARRMHFLATCVRDIERAIHPDGACYFAHVARP